MYEYLVVYFPQEAVRVRKYSYMYMYVPGQRGSELNEDTGCDYRTVGMFCFLFCSSFLFVCFFVWCLLQPFLH